MSISAANKFATKAKATIKVFDDGVGDFYKRFIRGSETPTADDVEALAKLIKDHALISKAYHTTVPGAVQGYGGPSDMKFSSAKTLLATIKKKVR